MSFDARYWAYMQRGISPLQKLILMGLSNSVDVFNGVTINVNELTDWTNSDRQAVKTALNDLANKRLITRDKPPFNLHESYLSEWYLAGVGTTYTAEEIAAYQNGENLEQELLNLDLDNSDNDFEELNQ